MQGATVPYDGAIDTCMEPPKPAASCLLRAGWVEGRAGMRKGQEEQQERGTGHALNDGGHDGLMERLWPVG